MNKHDLQFVRQSLLKERKRIFDRLQRLNSSLQELGEHEIEFEEEAQKANMLRLYNQLDSREQEKIEAFDLALYKLTSGSYGRCEGCGKMIAAQRLAVLPTARLCHRCAKSYEDKQIKLPSPGIELRKVELPIDYEGLSKEEIIETVMEHFRENDVKDLEEVELDFRHRILYLEGTISSEKEHQKIVNILTEIMGFSGIVDRLRIDELAWEREDRTPGRVEICPEDFGLDVKSDDESDGNNAFTNNAPEWEQTEL